VLPEQMKSRLVATSKDSVDVNIQTYPYKEAP
jgi:hypothetical protein